MPIVRLGTYEITSKDTIHRILDVCLAAGYRHIDTASGYRNEEHIGEALANLLPRYSLHRREIFLTSKVGPRHLGDAEDTLAVIKQSLTNLRTDYLDLLLVHWPGRQKKPPSDPDNVHRRRITWEVFQKAYLKGMSRAIGVSNYEVRHLQELECASVFPAVNQIEYHPHFQQQELVSYCKERGVQVQAYASLGTSSYSAALLSDPAVVEVAQQLRVSAAQVLLQWAVQRNIGVLPKSRNDAHIAANICLDFELKPAQMTLLDNCQVTRKYAWDPSEVA